MTRYVSKRTTDIRDELARRFIEPGTKRYKRIGIGRRVYTDEIVAQTLTDDYGVWLTAGQISRVRREYYFVNKRGRPPVASSLPPQKPTLVETTPPTVEEQLATIVTVLKAHTEALKAHADLLKSILGILEPTDFHAVLNAP